jgi:penicillin-binding protein 1B
MDWKAAWHQWKPGVRVAVIVAAALPVLCCVVGAIEYFRLAHIIDKKLAMGAFAGTANILSASVALAPGDPLSPAALAQELERSGYSQSPDHDGSKYKIARDNVEILPSSGMSGVRVEFATDKIAAIVSLADKSKLQHYELEPQLITNLSDVSEKRRLVRFQDIPPLLSEAVTSAEDKRFFRHSGFDLARIVKAALVDLKDGRKQEGASTLTMQLARALWLNPKKSWRRKIEESLITMHLEFKLTKQQIFELYANEVYLGRRGAFSINGFGEGAHSFFGKELSGIDASEAALLAGLVQRPSYYNPYRYPERARARRDQVLALMLRNGALSAQDYQAAIAEPVKIVPPAAGDSANYFIAMVSDQLQSKAGDAQEAFSVETTLDPNLQRIAEAAAASGMQEIDQQLHHGKKKGAGIPAGEPQVALIALDPRTGDIKALVGGRNYVASQLNHALAMRQPGSAFKPFVYAAAIDTAVEGTQPTFTPATLLSDQPTTFHAGATDYQPHDYHGAYRGDVILSTALANSLNVPAVEVAQQVGYQRVVEMAVRAGLNNNIKATPSVALGAYETTPLEIAGAYTMFANGGTWAKPSAISLIRSADGTVLYRHEPEVRQALDSKVAYVMTALMQEVISRGTGAGVRSRGFVLPAAGKTGTSRDGWFAGFTTELLCVVWVGFDDNRDLNLDGAHSALPVWAAFMKGASQFFPYKMARQFSAPDGVASARICADSGQLASDYCPNVRTEVFISGTQPGSMCPLHTGPTLPPDINSSPDKVDGAPDKISGAADVKSGHPDKMN